MKLKEAHGKFHEIEDKLDLFSKKINKLYFWERIRFTIFKQTLEKFGIIDRGYRRHQSIQLKNYLKFGVQTLRNFIFNNPLFSSQKEILFLGHERRKLREDGKWWDIYCDPIIENLNQSYLLVEYFYRFKHLRPAKTTNIRYLDFIFTIFTIRRIFRLNKVVFSDVERKLLLEIQNELYLKFDVEISVEAELKSTLLIRQTYLPICMRILKRVRPKLVILVVSYSNISEIFIEASKKLNIPVIELQHGNISPYHYGYSYSGSKRKKITFPDYFFTFGDFWKNTTEFPIQNERIISVGFPYLESERKRYLKIPKRNQILFISQGSRGITISKFAVELNNIIRSNFKIIYKLHPKEYNNWREVYPWLLESGIEVIDSDEKPLYRLFAESKVQIGVTSTAIYEGLNFGLYTFILNIGIEEMELLITSGYANVLTSPKDFEIAISAIKNIEIMKKDFIFRRNPLKHIYKEIDKLIVNTGS